MIEIIISFYIFMIHKRQIEVDFRVSILLLCLGLLVAQPLFAQAPSFEMACNTEDIDDNDNGLIELCYLEDVAAIQRDGTGLRRGTATLAEGCPTSGCNGYELVRNLDFTTTQSYMTGVVNSNWILNAADFMGTARQGWDPIGSVANNDCSDSGSRCFAAILEGNGYSISNLQINRDGANEIGLFAGNTGTIRNLGLREIEVEGNNRVGGLVGRNEGNLINAHVIDSRVEGSANNAGLLVGVSRPSALIINSYVRGTVEGSRWVGGICGLNFGRIINSYAEVMASGVREVGGLVAENQHGTIRNSYAMGSAHITANDSENRRSVGGLLAVLWRVSDSNPNPSVTNSYSTVRVTGNLARNNVGGLIGNTNISDPLITASYWDTETSERTASPGGGTPQTTDGLQMPTAPGTMASDVYYQWSTDDWDFGTMQTYAALRYAIGDDNDNPGCDVEPDTPLPPCGALLSGQAGRDRGLNTLFFVINGDRQDNTRVFRDRPFSPLVFDYDIKLPSLQTTIELIPYAVNDTATISVFSASDQDDDLFMGRRSGQESRPITLQANTNETMMVEVDGLTYNFNLIRGPQPSVEIVSFGTIPPTGTVDEGDDIVFEAVFRNGSEDYQYSLQQGGTALGQGQNSTATVTVTIPDNLVAAGEETTQTIYTITVDDSFDIVSRELMLTVNKIDNGEPQLELSVSPTMLSITSSVDDIDGVGTFSYQWQSRDEGDSGWNNLPSVTNSQMVAGNSANTIRYRVIVNHTDGQGHGKEYTIGLFPRDVDGDDDGLIDIYYLEDLNVIRYQVDGSGYTINPESDNIIADKIVSGCPANTCTGYELLRDLDFTTARSYVDATAEVQDQTTVLDEWTVDDPMNDSDTGWLPLATADVPFASLFNGNNNNISNLQINRDTADDSDIGLFAVLSPSARLENVGVLDVSIEGRGYVGGLVAQNEGVIVNSYAQGEVAGAQHSVGGLVALNSTATGVIINSYANVRLMSAGALLSGGLVGNNDGKIRNSYAAGNVGGACDVGGLVAENGSEGEIVNSYASGAVNRSGSCGDDGTRNRAGGLVADNAGLIRNSYVRGPISAGGGTAGGLFAVGATGTVEFSYWDSTVNSDITADSTAQTTADLLSLPSETGIYTNWNSADWDFGTAMQYPLLRYTSPTDIAIAAVCDDDLNTALPPCGSILLAQGEKGLSNLLFFTGDDAVALNRPFSLSLLSGYTVNVEDQTTIELLPYGINPRGESITITQNTTNTDYFVGKLSGEQSMPIPISKGESVLTISVGNDPTDTNPVTYSVTVNNMVSPVQVTDVTGPDTAVEGDPISLSQTATGGIGVNYTYRWTSEPADFLDGQTVTNATLSFNVPTDFVLGENTSRSVVIKSIVGDSFSESSAIKTVNIVKDDNGNPDFRTEVTVSTISIEAVPGSDPDGDGMITGASWERRTVDDVEWMPIPGQTSAMYSIPTEDRGDTRYRAQVVYIDAQGYSHTSSVLGPYRADIDDDDDGLIDIYYLEDLDTVRYQTDGSGYRASNEATRSSRGCMPVDTTETCSGYELRRDLDFMTTRSYLVATMNRTIWTVNNFGTDADTGWQPIGSIDGNSCSNTSSDCFTGVFEGNGYSISNLRINRDSTTGSLSDNIGLFVGNTGTIRNLGLSGIKVHGHRRVSGLVGLNAGNLINVYVDEGEVEGRNNGVGLLAGRSEGLIINSYVRGTVFSAGRFAGGICGATLGSGISNSYAIVDVTAMGNIGGLAGDTLGPIRNSYAMGSVRLTANANSGLVVGGLVGVMAVFNEPSITNSYSTVAVTADNPTGNIISGLIGDRTEAVDASAISDSYWDSNTSMQTTSMGGGTSKTTVELQMPTNRTAEIGIYANWNSADWDFGTSQTYAALRYAIGDDNANPGCDADPDTALPQCGDLLPGQIATVLPIEITNITVPETVNEGDVINLSAAVMGGNSDSYSYRWTSEPASLLAGVSETDIANPTLSFIVPTDFVLGEASNRDAVIELTVGDGLIESTATGTVTVEKVDNGNLSLSATVTTSTISIEILENDPDGAGSVAYTWEQRSIARAGWQPILNPSNSYTVPAQDASSFRYRVRLSYTDAQGYPYTSGVLGPFRAEIDDDDDGLIDIYYLEDLDAVRYQLDGTGYTPSTTTVKITRGCPLAGDNTETCSGYELRRDLSFTAMQSYVDATTNRDEWTVDNPMNDLDTGWPPIGGSFGSTFEGNGYSISNLQINRDTVDDSDIGLFAVLSSSARIKNVGLLNVAVEGRGYVGGLVAQNEGEIVNSYVQGEVKGAQHSVGGLVAFNSSSTTGVIVNSYANATVMSTGALLSGGLVGNNHGTIRNSYAAGHVSGVCDVGGLVAENGSGSEIINSYVSGEISRSGSCIDDGNRNRVGGLVADNAGLIRNSYVRGRVSGSGAIGGLFAVGATGTVESSYWDSTVNSGITIDTNARISADLQMPTMPGTIPTEIYYDWSTADWDFGDMTSYPALRYAEVDGVDSCDNDANTALPRCATLLSDQAGRNEGLSALFFVINGAEQDNDRIFRNQPFSSLLFDYDVVIPNTMNFQLRPYAINNTTMISIVKEADTSIDYFDSRLSGESSLDIPVSEGISEVIRITVDGVVYTLNLRVSPENPVRITSLVADPVAGSIVDEGQSVTLMFAVADGSSDNYRYSLQQAGRVIARSTDTTTFTAVVPTDFVQADLTTQSIVYTITVDDSFSTASAELMLIARKINNSIPQLELNIGPALLSISTTADADGIGTFMYQWERRDRVDSGWIDDSTSASATVPANSSSEIRYRVTVRHTDGQGDSNTYRINPFPVIVDGDSDGLIDLYYLEDLDTIRNSSDGSGYDIDTERDDITIDKNTLGCPNGGCIGYELSRSLDFDDDNSYSSTANKITWTTGAGWQPIGSISNDDCGDSASDCFNSIFEGNNNQLSNLRINRDTVDDAHIGLFTAVSQDARIENVGILDVAIEGRGYVGGLVARNAGVIVNSYVQGGAVTGTQHSLGGLVAINDSGVSTRATITNSYASVMTISTVVLSTGALVGRNRGVIRNSYASGNASGSCDVGGLVAENGNGSEIVNSYASGTVNRSGSCSDATRDRAAGLVAYNAGSIENSYVSGRVSGSGAVGGLVGNAEPTGTVTSSYWDSTVNSGITADADDGIATGTAALQEPTAPGSIATQIYHNWSTADWDFGTSRTYAVLRYAGGDDSDNPACDLDPDTPLPPCGALLLDQGGADRKGLGGLFFFVDGEPLDMSLLNKPFSFSVFSGYVINLENKALIELSPYGLNARGQSISIFRMGDTPRRDYFDEKHSGELSEPIRIPRGRSVLTIVVGDAPGDPDPVTYSFTVNNEVTTVEITDLTSNATMLEEGETINIEATVSGGARLNYRYQWTAEPAELLGRVSNADITSPTLSFSIPPDFVSLEATTRSAMIILTVRDNLSESRATETVVIEKVDNGARLFMTTVTTSEINIATVADDPDGNGDGTVDYSWELRSIDDDDWMSTSIVSNRYTVPAQDASSFRYRVRVSYTDAQGYDFDRLFGPYRADIDDDDDGLIDIYYLEDLDAVRYQTDGSGYTTSTATVKITRGCRPIDNIETCSGYELRRDLDFATTRSYVNAARHRGEWTVDNFATGSDGWQPIGEIPSGLFVDCNATGSDCLNSIFEGNGYSISNLQINRDLDGVGLFAGNNGTIRNLGLSEIRIEGGNQVGGIVASNDGILMNSHVDSSVAGVDRSVTGSLRVGLLAAANNGLIINSYARGDVRANTFVGGICGYSGGEIINSYADAEVVANNSSAGGLVGLMSRINEIDAIITDSYATGSVGAQDSQGSQGGIVGFLAQNTNIRNSYSTAEVTTMTASAGGLVGTSNASVFDSYWDVETSMQMRSAGGTSSTTAELQMPTIPGTTATEVYYNWSPDNWDFGNTMSYPALRYTDGGVDACAANPETALPRCGALLPEQNGRDEGLSILFFVIDDEEQDNADIFVNQPFSSLLFNYDVTIPYTENFRLRPYAINSTAAISITRAGDTQGIDYFNDASGELSDKIPLRGNMTEVLTITVDGVDYTLNIRVGPQDPVEITDFSSVPVAGSTVDEGDSVSLNIEIDGSSGDYDYLLQPGGIEISRVATTATFSVVIPDTFVEAGSTTQSITYTITVDDGFGTASAELMLVVRKTDNGEPQLEFNVGANSLEITPTVADIDGVGTFRYRWQSRAEGANDWTDISATNRYTVSGTPASTVRYRVIVNHTDGQQHSREYIIGPFPINVDGDGDGLIDVYYLEDLDAIRNRLDGSGYSVDPGSDSISVDKITLGCPSDTCVGYELLRDLNFTTEQSYVDATAQVQGQTTLLDEWTVNDPTDDSDSGWLPIGSGDTPFAALFRADNHKIFNLQINRDTVDDAHIGLFAALSQNARIENIGLLDVAIEGRGHVGSLVAQNEGVVVNSYVQGGEITGTQHSLGGLVASNSSMTGVVINSYASVTTTSTEVFSPGGLVGSNRGVIRNSYATGDVSGPCDVGGLVAESFVGSQIVNSYASGNVHRAGSCMDDGTLDSVGSLVGYHRGLIRNSYGSGRVSGSGTKGGLVGDAENSTVTFSYWDVETSMQMRSAGGTSQTTAELQMPTAPGSIANQVYFNWSTADWDFGTSLNYPIIRYTTATDILSEPACDDNLDTPLPQCGGVLLGQGDIGLSSILFFAGDDTLNEAELDPPFSLSVLSGYTVNTVDEVLIRLLPYGIDVLGETIAIFKTGDTLSVDYFEDRRSGELSAPIPISRGQSVVTVRVGDDPDTVDYSFIVNNEVSAVEVTDVAGDFTMRREGETVSLSATVQGGISDNYSYRWTSEPASLLAGLSEADITSRTLSFSIPLDFVSRDVLSRDAEIKLTVGDGFSVSSATETVTVEKVNDGDPNFTATVTAAEISIATVGDDPDGIGVTVYAWEQRSIANVVWEPIPGVPNTSNTYTVPPQNASSFRYRVRLSHTDAQGNPFSQVLGPFRAEIDDDDDGLIDIYYLEDLDAVRYQTDGSAYTISTATVGITRGCRLAGDNTETCSGYELRRDLDFATTRSYVDATTNRDEWTVDDPMNDSDSGWLPIGSIVSNDCEDSGSNCFTSTFEGNGYDISNLQINRDTVDDSDIGLFAVLSSSARIENVGLLNVAVEGRGHVGGLVAQNEGEIVNSYVRGEVKGTQHSVGGLVASNSSSMTSVIVNSYADATVMSTDALLSGGLVGNNHGKIRNSYAAGNVRGSCNVGGLVAENGSESEIVNSYVSGEISRSGSCSDDGTRNRVGGLVVDNAGLIRNSYVRGRVSGSGTIGGLIGDAEATGTVEFSYWDSTVNSGLTTDTNARISTDLQSPVAAIGIYAQWNTADWDFGGTTSYPALRYAEVDGVDACDSDANTALPRCGALLSDQAGRDEGLSALFFVINSAEQDNDRIFGNQPFSSLVFDYDVVIPNTAEFQLRPYAIDSEATISIVKVADTSTDYFDGRLSGESSLDIPVSEGITEVIRITVDGVAYTLRLRVSPENPVRITNFVSDPVAGSIVDEGQSATLTFAVADGSSVNYRYSLQQAGREIAQSNDPTFTAVIPLDFVQADLTTQSIVYTITVDDSFSTASAELELIANKENNGEPQLELRITPTFLSTTSTVADVDGAGTFTYRWERRERIDVSWMEVSTTFGVSIPADTPGEVRYRVTIDHTDGQGYRNTYLIGPFPAGIDGNNNGLIDIYYLEDLDAMRNQLDGSGYSINSGYSNIIVDENTSGCPDGGCRGYELSRSLDFNEDTHYLDAAANKERWTTGTGWQPIGDFDNPFSAIFMASTESLTISNLTIDRRNESGVGLFGESSGRITDIRLSDVSVRGYSVVGGLVGSNRGQITAGSVTGSVESVDTWAGGLVGTHWNEIKNSYAQVDVSGYSSVGGLVGYSFGTIADSYAFGDVKARIFGGGLVGFNQGPIARSYASGSVESAFYAGGLIGYNDSYIDAIGRGGVIENVYATGNVIGGTYLGGLAGYNDSDINNGYAIGRVIGGGGSGGLVGFNDNEGVITNSYWDIDTTGQATSDGGIPRTTVQLQMPTEPGATADMTYYQWSDSAWNFGSTTEYPTLKDEDGNDLPLLETRLGTSLGLGALVLSGLQLSDGMLEPPFDPTKTSYELLDLAGEQTTMTATTAAENAVISIEVDSQTASTGNLAVATRITDTVNNIVIRVTVSGRSTATYTVVLPANRPSLAGIPKEPCSLTDVDQDDDRLIEICDIEGLYAMRYRLDGSAYKASSAAAEIDSGCPQSGCIGYELMNDLDFGNPDHYRDGSNRAIWTVTDYADDSDKGWRPIGDFAVSFNATFKANSHTISGLQTNRDDNTNGRDYAGLFGHIGARAQLDGVDLSAIDVRGRFVVGGLVGRSDGGTVINSSVEGIVAGSPVINSLGSSWIGGMVGSNNGAIVNSYAQASVFGHTTIGGLVGVATKGSDIRNSYALGSVNGINYVGGLAGFNQGRFENCYARVSIGGVFSVAGLVALNDDEGVIRNSYAVPDSFFPIAGLVETNQGTIIDSYWQRSDTVSSSDGGIGLMPEVLQASASFPGWLSANWDFTDGEYPGLKYAEGGDPDNPACETPPPDTQLPNCGTLLANQRLGLERIELVGVELFPNFNSAINNYSASVSVETTNVMIVVSSNNVMTPININGVEASGNVSSIVKLAETEDTKITIASVEDATTYTVVIVKQSEIAGFVPSRFAGRPADPQCRNCNPTVDGVVQIRFADETLSQSGDSIRVKLQFRRLFGGDGDSRYIASAGLGLRYNPAVFGQCTHERSDFFTATDNYAISFSDTDVDELRIAETGIDLNAGSDEFSALGEAWKDLVTLTCAIPNRENELGAAIAGTAARQVVLYRYDSDGDAIPSVALLSANNDLRGLRADDRSYVEAYMRHSDGKGVRLKFSKGVAVFPDVRGGTQSDAVALTTDNFSLAMSTDAAISTVTHVVGSRYVNIEFDRVVVNNILRLVSTSTSIIYDVDDAIMQGEALAHDSFAAELAYDSEAPVVERLVESVTVVQETTRNIIFNKPLNPATVSIEALCLADEEGLCAGDDEATGSSITSVVLMEDNSVLQVGISSAEQVARDARIEFRRGALLGTDYRWVEEYQVALRDPITIPDVVAPTITVSAVDGTANIETQTHTRITYGMSFTVSANEPVVGLNTTSSYSLLRVPDTGDAVLVENAVPSTTTVSGTNQVTVSYSGIEVPVSDVTNTRGFTLRRTSDTSLQDLSGKDPIGSSSGFLDATGVSNGSAVAQTGDLDNTAQLMSLSLSVESESSPLSPPFDPAVAVRSYSIANVANSVGDTTISVTAQNPANIRLIRIGSSSDDDIAVNALSVTSDAIPLEEGGTTTITIVVIAQDGTTEEEYTVAVERLPSMVADLEALEVVGDSGTIELDPDFSTGETEYTARVRNDLETILINTTATQSAATIQIAKTEIMDNTPRMPRRSISLDQGTTTTIVVRVTAQDGTTTANYVVTVVRLPSTVAGLEALEIVGTSGTIELDPDFSTGETEYTARVRNDLETILINTTATQSAATIQIAKTEIMDNTPRMPRRSISLDQGTTTTIVVRVTAQDGTTTANYVVTVVRLPSTVAGLEALEIVGTSGTIELDPDFSTDETEYTARVRNDLETVSINTTATQSAATIQIAKTEIMDNTPRMPRRSITLDRGTTTTVVVRVTAQDGTTTANYVVTVVRLPSTVADLEALEVVGDSGTIELDPDFSTGETEYTARVRNDLETILINTTATQSAATIQIAKTEIMDNTPRMPRRSISLDQGTTTTIVVRVTAQDGTTTANYVVTVVRLPSTVAGLEALEIVGTSGTIELDPDFSTGETEYTARVRNDLETILINTTATQSAATIQIAKTEIMDNTPRMPRRSITLDQGTTTTIIVRVTAQDGTTPLEDYTITVVRLPSTDAMNAIRIRVKVFLEGPLQ